MANESRHAQLPRPRLCYVEIPADDAARSAAFYEAVFGWEIRRRDTDRPAFTDAAGDVSGAWVEGRPAAREPGLLPYIWVDGIDSTLQTVVANGGEVVDEPGPDAGPSGEWIATFRDPAGNLIGLYQEGPRG